MNGDWLRTMVAVVDEGSFEAAADELHISASAVSQRVKALEAHLGQMVVRRTLPCTPTPAGEAVLRMARQVMLLTDEMYAGLARDEINGKAHGQIQAARRRHARRRSAHRIQRSRRRDAQRI